ncbi:UPF0058 family protein [Halosimplex pelagicum]|uniref:UPF0058 family protein n=1 Tax=Halosimplex pelagicum TaxID=869886 RepID=A0A7D5P6A2_9EURY|nr:UPF0058 family protein [Halosimplex pelagicum]QLH81906.1 UPF0058 family protein [Halosimplex pelagicum]
MRKRESLYLHALFVLVRREFEDERDLAAGPFDEYDGTAVGPTAVHRPKAAHERALFALSTELSATAASATDDTERPRPDAEGSNQYAR